MKTHSVFVAAALVFSTSSIHADDRQPIPNEASQREVAALVQEVFGQEIENAKTPDQKSALTKKLLEQASRSDASPDGRYALLKAALTSAPDASVAMPVVDEMAKHFQIDPLKVKASTVWRFSKKSRTSSQYKAVANAAVRLIDQAVERDSYDSALKLGEIALAAARKARDATLVRTIRTRVFEVEKRKVEFGKVKDSLAVLETKPTDAKANVVVGRYKCLVKGDWEAGVPMLALGDDDVLRELAVKELKGPKTSNEQVSLADGWYDLAEKSAGRTKERMLERAGFWYRLSLRSMPVLSGLVKVKIERRLKETSVVSHASKPMLVKLTEINTEEHDCYPWVSHDGLTIYWNVVQRADLWATDKWEIWMATRESAASPFRSKKRLLSGRQPTVSADGLQMVFLTRSGDSERFHLADRDSVKESFKRPVEIPVFQSIKCSGPCLSRDGLTLYFTRYHPANRKQWDIYSSHRRVSTANWSPPKPLPIELNELPEGLPTWGFITNNGLKMLTAVEGVGKWASGPFYVWERRNKAGRFIKPKNLQFDDIEGVYGTSPRYVESTGELFFCTKRDGHFDIWVVRNVRL